MRVNSHESFHQLSSSIINSGQTRTRVDESTSRVTTNKRKLSSTLMKMLSTFKDDERALESMGVHAEFQATQGCESLNSHQLSSSFGLGLTNIVMKELTEPE